jgi:tetratricopeptide (TPR) repeat protein
MLAEHEAASRLLEEAIALRREVGEVRGVVRALNWYGNVLARASDFERSAAIHTEALTLRRELNDENGMAASLGNLGSVALMRGDYTEATALYEQALPIMRRAGDDYAIGLILGFLAQAAVAQGDMGGAEAWLREALPFITRVRPPGIVSAHFVAAVIAHARGALERAARLFGAVDAQVERLGTWSVPNQARYLQIEQVRQDAREALVEDAFTAAYANGQALSLDEAVALALEQAPAPDRGAEGLQ